MTALTRPMAQRLAEFIHMARPEWNTPGILAALEQAASTADALAIARALVNIADDPSVKTPGMLTRPGQHWRNPAGELPPRRGEHDVPCPEHALSEPCPACRARNEADAITEQERARLAAELRAEITAGLNRFHTRPMPSRVPPPGDAPRTENQ